jgi:hypothetical protein
MEWAVLGGPRNFLLDSVASSAKPGREVGMGLYVGSTVINTPDLEGPLSFWAAALGYVVRSSDPGFAVLTDTNRHWSNVSLQRSAEPKQGLNRVHLDLYTEDREGEVSRLEELGATRVPW